MAQVDITESDSGKIFVVATGDMLLVQLVENPTTGFRWAVSALPPLLAPQGDAFQTTAAATIGGGGLHSFRFLVQAPGTGELRFQLSRAWEAGPARTQVSFLFQAP